MKLSVIKLTSIAALGLAIAACQPNAEDEEINAAADDLFAPVDVSSNTASEATFPTELSNTEVAANENQNNSSVSTSQTSVNSALAESLTNGAISTVQSQSQLSQLSQNQSLNQSTASQLSTNLREIPAPVLVKPATSSSIITRSVQSNPAVAQRTSSSSSNLSCAAPTSKAALAAYAAHCTKSVQHSSVENTITTDTIATDSTTTVTTAPKKITTTTTEHVAGEEPKVTRVVRTFAPVDISCSDTPTTKAALAAYRANCLKRVGAPVRLSSEQTYIRPTSSSTTLNTAPEQASSSTSIVTNDRNTSDNTSPDLAPATSESTESTDNATSSSTAEEIEESPVAPSGSALFDCSKDPSTGAELALFRAYCQG